MIGNSTTPADSVRGAGITVSGSPRTYQVVSVPVPDALLQSVEVEVSITARGEFSVLGSPTRIINPLAGHQIVGITIGIPAAARAGRRLAAEVAFAAPASPTVLVPVEIDVNLIRSIALRQTASVNAQAGSDVVLPFSVANRGNGDERLATEVTVPGGWSTGQIKEITRLTLSPGESVTRQIRLKVPLRASTGTSFVQVDVLAGSDTVAVRTMTIEVFNDGSIGRQSGPVVITALTRALDEHGQPSDLLTLAANGALYDSVRIDGQLSIGALPGAAAGYAYAHLGTYQSPAAVTLSAPHAQLGLGLTGGSFSELTGLYTYGQGAHFYLQRNDWNLLALGAVSLRTPFTNDREPMLGLRAEHRLGVASVSGSVTHLGEAGPYSRHLDALGLGAVAPVYFMGTLRMEVAERRYKSGEGVGWSSELVRSLGDNNLQLRATHAPGGSDAFARSTDELLANVTQRISSRVLIGGSAWRTTDATSVFSGLETKGFAVRPQFRLGGATTLALEARSYFYDATSRPGVSSTGTGFGSREEQLGAILSASVRRFYLNANAYLGNLTHTATLSGQLTTTERVPRNYWTAAAGWSGVPGFLEVQTRIEQTRNQSGLVLQQNIFGIRGDAVILPWLYGIRAVGEAQRVVGFGDWRASTVRGGLAVPLTNGLAFSFGVERNTIFRASDGSVPWIVGARIEHASTLPMLRTPGTSGYVYRDLNGNQRRDEGEPGVAGVIVRRSGQTAVADDRGRYRVGGDAHQEITVDEASLPDGLSPNGTSRHDLALTQSGDAEVELVVAQRPGLTPIRVDFSKAHITARDNAGREWSATMTGPAIASFLSLPIGTYQLEFDLSEIGEPLVPREPIPLLMIVSRNAKPCTVTLDPRPVQLWDGSGRNELHQKAAPPPEGPDERERKEKQPVAT
ncbi:MAG TPA: hypothetical protein VIH53_04555 [Gemmatimonadaceae bacterium]